MTVGQDLIAGLVVGIVGIVFYLRMTKKTLGETIREIREGTQQDEQAF